MSPSEPHIGLRLKQSNQRGHGERRADRRTTGMQGNKANPFEEPVEIEVPEARDESGQTGEEFPTGGSEAADDGRGAGSSLEAQLAASEQELARHREAMLRMQAEMENLRKRLTREAEKSRKFALERIMKDLLQVRDSMERGLEVADETATVESLREGQELTLKMLAKVLQDHDLEVIDPAGQPFDPEWHEAMTVVPSGEVEENTVLEVLQKGYRLHDRLIRPAMVVVSRKP
jgi:molecular chaperone GrpE